VYTLEFSGGRGLKSRVDGVEKVLSAGALVVLANAERAVEAASVGVFGVRLKADPRHNILLRRTNASKGDVDSLFTGAGLHVLLERKRRLESAKDAEEAITQLRKTLAAYQILDFHVVRGVPCRVESMVFAEALGAAAEATLLAAGIYVLRAEDLRVLSPPAGAAALV